MKFNEVVERTRERLCEVAPVLLSDDGVSNEGLRTVVSPAKPPRDVVIPNSNVNRRFGRRRK